VMSDGVARGMSELRGRKADGVAIGM
jgi:hypothetical protein